MTASNPQWRPGCAEAATLLRTFHDQASGPSIEEFAAEAIAPVARANRKLPVEGDLAGRRYVVSARAFEPDPRTSGETPRLVAQEVSGAPRPAAVTRAAVVEDPSASGTHPGAGGTQPSSPQPAAAPPLALPAGAEGDAAFWTSAFARRLPGLLENDLSTRPTVIETPAERASATGEIGRGAAAGVHRSFPDGVIGHPRGGPAPHPGVPAVLDGQAPSRSPTVPFEPRTLIVESTRTVISEGPPPEAPAPAGPPARVARRALTFEPPPPAEPPTPVAPPLPPEPEDPVEEEEPVAAPNWFARIVAVGLGVTVAGGVLLLLTTAAVAFVFRDRWMSPAAATSPLVASAAPGASGEPTAQAPNASAEPPNPSAQTGAAPAAEPSLGAPPAAEVPTAADAGPPGAASTDPTSQGGGATTTEAAPTTPVQVTIWVKTASPQWIHLQSPSGDDLAQGNDRCAAQVPPGDYRLVVKLVGRPAVSGTLKLTGSEVRMECVPQPDASVTCSGGGLPVYLKP